MTDADGIVTEFQAPASRRTALLQPSESLEALKAACPLIDGLRIICWFSVPGDPVPKARPRFDQRHGRTYTPERTVEAERLVADYLKEAHPHLKPCAEPVGLRLRFYLKGTGRGDWDNYGKLVSDALNGKAWLDDKQVRKADVDLIDHNKQPRSDILVYRLREQLL